GGHRVRALRRPGRGAPQARPADRRGLRRVRREAGAGDPARASTLSIELEIEGDNSPAVREAALAALEAAGVDDGHLAIAFVRPEQIAVLNHEHRGREGPTDVLSFPIDGTDPVVVGPRELGDVIICREHTTDVVE